MWIIWERFFLLNGMNKEATTGGILQERVFAKFSGKKLCQCLFFNKVRNEACNFVKKRECGTGVFLWMLQNFYEDRFYRTPLGDYLWSNKVLKQFLNLATNNNATTNVHRMDLYIQPLYHFPFNNFLMIKLTVLWNHSKTIFHKEDRMKYKSFRPELKNRRRNGKLNL